MTLPRSGRTTEPPLRIACVHTRRDLRGEPIGGMNLIRFARMSDALARRGHQVHLIVNGTGARLCTHPGVREVSHKDVRWDEYDVVKTYFHSGFDTLRAWGGDGHPFIVSNLGSVVGSEDCAGVYFYGGVREALWATQQQVASRSRVVSLLTRENRALWHRMHGDMADVIDVPAGVDTDVPPPGANPYTALGITGPVALFAGNIYTRLSQAEVNELWQRRLNALGRALGRLGVRLVAMGPGATDLIEPADVTHVGVVDFREFWSWQWHAHVGVVLAQGPVQDNESTKIYYYLRTGLPVVCERSVPNAWLVSETGHGALVDWHDEDLTPLAEATAEMAHRPPKADGVISHVIAHHSWDVRAALYADVLARAGAGADHQAV